jgi:hypothetical protein
MCSIEHPLPLSGPRRTGFRYLGAGARNSCPRGVYRRLGLRRLHSPLSGHGQPGLGGQGQVRYKASRSPWGRHDNQYLSDAATVFVQKLFNIRPWTRVDGDGQNGTRYDAGTAALSSPRGLLCVIGCCPSPFDRGCMETCERRPMVGANVEQVGARMAIVVCRRPQAGKN